MASGRGQLNSFERLPRECTPIIAWANDQLRDREKTQTEIYEEFFAKMQALQAEHRGELQFTIPSFSAFNRQSIRLATQARRMDDTREITSVLAERWDAKSSDELLIIASEAVKTLVFELLMAAGPAGFEPKEAKALADTLYAASKAQSVSSARREKVEATFEADVNAAVDHVAKVKGMTAETADAIKAQILGVKAA